ncbi:coiled-coil domain-containing protein 173 [Salarias fasciatus]|uniref:coiled-coil domain-containing protein 173 n=1 Tax=Salarias fasciatus TaxID=181472 RepID=UPI001176D0A3|nr:coiled-coil domain-containing protein 173 [Salarias fasciatus]
MAAEAQQGSEKRAEDADGITQPPDLRQITVLRKAEWQKIQDKLNQVNREEERMREAAERRKALHLQSQEVVKLWSSTITSQTQKKLEAKKIREQIEEEKRKQIDIEEAKYQEQKRREAIEKAKTQLYYQTNRVKGLHSALLLTEVLKEREAQLELKKRIKSATKDTNKMFLDVVKTKEEEASRKEQEKAEQRRHDSEAVAEELKHRIRENEAAKEREKLESKKEGEEIQRLQELYQWEHRMESEKQETEKRNLMRAHLEHIANRDLMRALEAQKQEAEEEKRKVFLSTKQKMMKLRKEKEKELLQEAQTRRERILNSLVVTQQQQTSSEEERIARAVAEQDRKEALLRLKEEEKRAAMLKSIAQQRELLQQEKEQRDKLDKQKKQDELQARKEMLRISSEKQELQVEKSVRREQLRLEEQELEVRNAELAAMEDRQFQQYSHGVISVAAEAQRNVFPLCKAAREGFGGGPGPVRAVRKSYLVQDGSGAQMPNYVSGTTEDIRKLHEPADIQDAKKRLGFTW